MLFLLFGSSASGKTTLVDDVRRLVSGVEGHDFDEIDVPARADTAWRHRAYGAWLDVALGLQKKGIDLLLCGQIPFGEVLAAPDAVKLEAISACLVDCDDVTRTSRLHDRGAEWFARTAELERHLRWADWLRRHASDPQWMPHVIRIPETQGEMRWERWRDWRAGDARWHVKTLDTTSLSRDDAARTLGSWIESERELFRSDRHPLAAGWSTRPTSAVSA